MSQPRRQIFVNASLQSRFLVRVALYWVIYHGLLWHAMFIEHYLEYRRSLTADSMPQTFLQLYAGFAEAHLALVYASLALLPIVLWDALSFTHRIAGPIVRFRQVLAEMVSRRRVETVNLRRGDLLSELQDSLNDYLPLHNAHIAPAHIAPAHIAESSVRPISLDDTSICELRELQKSFELAQTH